MRLERNSFECDVIATYLFQFHKGAIRTLLSNLSENVTLNFNSIKVRLEQSIADHSFEGYSRFQFHKGAIRTDVISGVKTANQYFNSIKVRLELRIGATLRSDSEISIP